MNIRQFLMGSLAFAVIVCASCIGLYFHSSVMQSKQKQVYHQTLNLEVKNKPMLGQDKKREADEYYADTMYEAAYIALRDNDNDQALRWATAKKDMIADGYSHAEAGLIERDSARKAHRAIDYVKFFYEKAYSSLAEKDEIKRKKLAVDLVELNTKIRAEGFSEKQSNTLWQEAWAKAIVDFNEKSAELARKHHRRHFYRLYNWANEKWNQRRS